MVDFLFSAVNLDSKKTLSYEEQIVKNCLNLRGKTNL